MNLYLISQVCLILFNVGNAHIDAYRILKNKHIAHGINFVAYCLFVTVLCLLFRYGYWEIVVFGISAFTNRQFSFDIPLNLRRRLDWDYVSKANPPKSILDQIEIRLFGYNGRAPFLVYGAVWVACLIIKMLI